MAELVQIGNSMGIRIPKPLIKEAGLEGRALHLRVVDGGLLIEPERRVREGWAESFRAMHAAGDDAPLMPDSTSAFDDKDWQW